MHNSESNLNVVNDGLFLFWFNLFVNSTLIFVLLIIEQFVMSIVFFK